MTLTDFNTLGLSSRILQTVEKLGFDAPTPIQQAAIPLVLDGQDLIGLAQTGTGKTAAFGLPIVDQLLGAGAKPAPKTVRALILAPTRELANQISINMRNFVKNTPLKVNVIVGGMSINMQVKNMSRGTDILVATPGRLLDIVERKGVYLDTVQYLVLDEADQMLDLGFIHSLRKIAQLVGTPRQTLLFSATMAKQVENLSRAYLTDPVRVETAPQGRAADKIEQSVHFVAKSGKTEHLIKCLRENPDDLSLIFTRTKYGAEKLMKTLVANGFTAGSIHGNKNQNQRDRALKAFRSGKTRILVATDVAARGIDIPGVKRVYNFELPEVAENYVHRIGRTARAGAEGEAVAFCAAEEYGLWRAIEKLMGIEVTVASGQLTEEERRSAVGSPYRRGRKNNQRRSSGRNGEQGAPKIHRKGSSTAKPRRRKNDDATHAKPDARKQHRKGGSAERSSNKKFSDQKFGDQRGNTASADTKPRGQKTHTSPDNGFKKARPQKGTGTKDTSSKGTRNKNIGKNEAGKFSTTKKKSTDNPVSKNAGRKKPDTIKPNKSKPTTAKGRNTSGQKPNSQKPNHTKPAQPSGRPSRKRTKRKPIAA